MRKLYYLGAATAFTGTLAFIFALGNHIQNVTAGSLDLLISTCAICLGSIVMSSIKCKRA